MFFRKAIKKNKILYSIAQILAHRKEKEYIDLVCGLRSNPHLVTIQSKQNTIGSAPICIIEMGYQNGMFACVRKMLDGLYYCDNMGFIPYFRMTDSFYYDPHMPSELNPFDYYFTQPFESEALFDTHPLVNYSPGKRSMGELINGADLYTVNKEYIHTMALMMRRYLHFNDVTLSECNRYSRSLDVDCRTLGVHIRGTDYKKAFNGHPVMIETSDYYPIIDSALKSGSFDKIFLATDDEEILNEFVGHYTNVVYSSEIQRAKGDIGVHALTSEMKVASPYQTGLEAILDMYALACCGGLVSGASSLPLCSRIFKLSRDENYSFDFTISKGINHNKNKPY